MSEKKRRDRLGRWLDGVSGNPKGRPHKFARIDHGDLEIFKNTAMEVNTPDGRVMMTREAAVLHRLYQTAMKGNVHAQIFLARRFEQYNERKGGIAAELYRINADIREAKRAPTDREMDWIDMARERLYPNLQEDLETAKPVSGRRPRRKPKRRDGASDAGSDP